MGYYPAFAHLVNEALRRLDRSPSWLAQRLGVNASTVSRWLNQAARPRDPETVARVADILGLGAQRQELLTAAGFAYSPHSPLPHRSSESGRPQQTLPIESTPFVGRDAQLSHIGERLANPECRLLTIVGPGGIGKTRLAIRAAQAYGDQFADGVCFVDLSSVRAPAMLAAIILRSLHAPESGAVDAARRLCEFLRGQELLLLLDNFEHLIAGVDLLPQLLRAAPGLKLLVTSRERLNLSEEWLEPVEGLDLPPTGNADLSTPDGAPAPVTELTVYDATRLFLTCMRRLRPEYEPSGEDAVAIAAICRALDGMPLAIELAAAWTRTLPPTDVLRKSERSLDFLQASMRDIPPRHRSIRAVFDHSWSMLSARERSILRQFSIFRGATQGALANVTGAALADLSEIIDKSWLRPNVSGRFTMHELVRQYCEEKLESEHASAAGEDAGAVRRRHCAYYGVYLKTIFREVNYDPRTLATVLAEFGNLLAALYTAVDSHDMRTALDICWTIFFVGDMMGWLHFSIQTMDTIIPVLEERLADAALVEPERTAVAHVLAGVLHAEFDQYRQLGLHRQAGACSKRFSSLVQTMRPGREQIYWQAFASAHEAGLAYDNGDYVTARQLREESLSLFGVDGFECFVYGKERGVIYWQAQVYAHLGLVHWALGDYAAAEACYDRSIRMRDASGEQRSQGIHMERYARLRQTTGDYTGAEELARKGLHFSELCGDRLGTALGRLAMGRLLAVQRRGDAARQCLFETLAIARQSGRLDIVLWSLCELGGIDLAEGNPAQARRRFEEACAAFEHTGIEHHNGLVEVEIGLARTALLEGNCAEARDLFLQALRRQGRTAVDTMNAIAGMAEISAQEGDMAQAISYLKLVTQHSVTDHATRLKAKQQLRDLEREVES
jgi:predicted ATPase